MTFKFRSFSLLLDKLLSQKLHITHVYVLIECDVDEQDIWYQHWLVDEDESTTFSSKILLQLQMTKICHSLNREVFHWLLIIFF